MLWELAIRCLIQALDSAAGFRANHPCCIKCGGPARPVLRLSQPDFSFKPDPDELAKFEQWKQRVWADSGRVVVLELGCGELDSEPSTARHEAETFVAELNRPAVTAAADTYMQDGVTDAWQVADARATLVRVNAVAPEADDPTLLHGSEVVSLLTSCATAAELLMQEVHANAHPT
jgi:hypothetical protein